MGKAMIGVLAIVCAVLASACSSSSDGGGGAAACTFTGNYDITYGAASGDTGCPDLTAQHPTATYVVQGDGKVTAPAPSNAVADSGNTFDQNTCKEHAVFTSTKTPDPGCDAESFTFDQTFTASGFAGTYTFAGCAASGATLVHVTCTYPVSGTKK